LLLDHLITALWLVSGNPGTVIRRKGYTLH